MKVTLYNRARTGELEELRGVRRILREQLEETRFIVCEYDNERRLFLVDQWEVYTVEAEQ